MARDRLPLPPSNVTGELGNYLHTIWQVVNGIPNLSFFSGVHPDSNLTGLAGDIAVNVSPSQASRIFVKYGSVTQPDRFSWTTVA